MPASTIKSIEVILIPPAKYDAEGLAGIINIVTIKQSYNGYQGSLSINEKGPLGGQGTDGTFSLKYGKLSLTAVAGASRFRQPNSSATIHRTVAGLSSDLAGGSLSYRFGKLQSKIKKNKRGVKNDDLQ